MGSIKQEERRITTALSAAQAIVGDEPWKGSFRITKSSLRVSREGGEQLSGRGDSVHPFHFDVHQDPIWQGPIRAMPPINVQRFAPQSPHSRISLTKSLTTPSLTFRPL